MAVSQNAFKTANAVANREQIDNVVDLIQRSDTPIYSSIGKADAKAVFFEWTASELDAPGPNRQTEGRDYAFASTEPNKRMGNYTQILAKSGKFTKTQEAVDNTGKAEQVSKKKAEKLLALRTDIEYSIVDNVGSQGGDDRISGGLASFAETNVTRGAAGANGGYDANTKVTVAPTNGTQRSFSKALLDELLQTAYSSGAQLSKAFMAPYVKGVFAEIMSDANVAQFRKEATKSNNAIIADAEIYIGPLGQVTVVPNAVMGGNATIARNVFVLDTKRIKWAWLRKITEDPELAKTGDYQTFVFNGEGGLKPSHEKAVGVIADVFGVSATE